MLPGPESLALVATKSIGNVSETLYFAKGGLIAHWGPRRELRSPHAGLVDAINHVGTMSRTKGHDHEYTPCRVDVDTAVQAFNDQKYRVPYIVEVVGTPAPVQTVATLAPVQVVGTVSSAAF
jgi:hypothetical protein